MKDDLDTYRATVERVLTEYAEFLTTDEDIVCETIFDCMGDHYLLVEIGWENGYRIYGPLLHIDICGGNLWIQNDGTEQGIAVDFVAANVPKSASFSAPAAPPCAPVGFAFS